MKSKRKTIGRTLVCLFCGGLGAIAGALLSNYSFPYIIVSFFAVIGFSVLGVLVFAIIYDDRDDDRSYPTPSSWDKLYEDEN